MEGISNGYLENLCKKTLKNFIGVFPCDIQPEISKIKSFSLIFNESQHDEGGTHFVAVHANKNCVYYFDSLGLKLENDFIKMFLYSCGRKVCYENIQIQSFDSSFCGFFCMFFLMYMERKNARLKKFYSFFNHSNLPMNNSIVTDLIIVLIKKNKSSKH